jgi:hypothetical protein
MGNQHGTTNTPSVGMRSNRFSSGGGELLGCGSGSIHKSKLLREHKRHGFVSVKINASNSGRRLGEGQITNIVTPKGAILYGSLFNPSSIQRG